MAETFERIRKPAAAAAAPAAAGGAPKRWSFDQKPEAQKAAPVAAKPVAPPPANGQRFDTTSSYVELKVRLHQKLLEMINLSAIDKMSREQIQTELSTLIRDLLTRERIPLNAQERARLVSDVVDELLGLGPIEPLLKDPTVNDIICNTYAKVYVERHGRLELTAVKFKDDRHLLRIIDKIVSSVGRRIDESHPMVDARLKDGSRVNAVVAPIAVDGPLLSIRKFSRDPMDMQKLIEMGSITPPIAELMGAIVRCRLNVLISGGTGSGKTTMLNALSDFIGQTERIVTIEDAAELRLQQEHVARMETRPPNIEGKGEIAQRQLVKNALRMRPDRIIVGEVRGAEAVDMLQAMNTGHDGSMTTIHANTCRDALSRLEQMISMAGFDLPLRSMRQQIASAVHIVLQLQRFSDGKRRLVSLYEIVGMEGDVVTMQEIFTFKQTGVSTEGDVQGDYRATGIRPHFVDKLRVRGINLSADIFAPNRAIG